MRIIKGKYEDIKFYSYLGMRAPKVGNDIYLHAKQRFYDSKNKTWKEKYENIYNELDIQSGKWMDVCGIMNIVICQKITPAVELLDTRYNTLRWRISRKNNRQFTAYLAGLLVISEKDNIHEAPMRGNYIKHKNLFFVDEDNGTHVLTMHRNRAIAETPEELKIIHEKHMGYPGCYVNRKLFVLIKTLEEYNNEDVNVKKEDKKTKRIVPIDSLISEINYRAERNMPIGYVTIGRREISAHELLKLINEAVSVEVYY